MLQVRWPIAGQWLGRSSGSWRRQGHGAGLVVGADQQGILVARSVQLLAGSLMILRHLSLLEELHNMRLMILIDGWCPLGFQAVGATQSLHHKLGGLRLLVLMVRFRNERSLWTVVMIVLAANQSQLWVKK